MRPVQFRYRNVCRMVGEKIQDRRERGPRVKMLQFNGRIDVKTETTQDVVEEEKEKLAFEKEEPRSRTEAGKAWSIWGNEGKFGRKLYREKEAKLSMK